MARGPIARGAVAEPLTPARPRRDWTARARGTALDAIRYSHFVALMKRALPLAAAAVLAAVLVYSFFPRQPDRVTVTAQRIATLDNDLAMIKPRLTGNDDDGNPFVITADAAVQDPKHPHQAHMKTIEADMSLTGGRWINATAARGFFNMDSGVLNLTDGIAVYSDSGYELHTAKVDIQMKKGFFHGPGVVTGHGPFGTLRADRFDVDRLKQQVHLVGHVQTIFYPLRTK